MLLILEVIYWALVYICQCPMSLRVSGKKNIDNSYLLAHNLLENTVNEFKKTLEFNNLLNKATNYALEESNY